MNHEAFLQALKTLLHIPEKQRAIAGIVSEQLSASDRETLFQKLCLVEARLIVAAEEEEAACIAMSKLVHSSKKALRRDQEKVSAAHERTQASAHLDHFTV